MDTRDIWTDVVRLAKVGATWRHITSNEDVPLICESMVHENRRLEQQKIQLSNFCIFNFRGLDQRNISVA